MCVELNKLHSTAYANHNYYLMRIVLYLLLISNKFILKHVTLESEAYK